MLEKYVFLLTKIFLFFSFLLQINGRLMYLNCTSQGSCFNCITQYQCDMCLTSSYEECCPLFCTECSSMNTCIECEPNFNLEQVGNEYLCVRRQYWTDPYLNQLFPGLCFSGYYYDSVINTCLSCNFPNCQTCQTSQTCTLCQQGYFLQTYSGMSNCLPCAANCYLCTNLHNCTQCNTGFYLDQNLNCQACQIPNCVTCSNQNVCSECIQGVLSLYVGYYLSQDNSKCILCTQSVQNCNNCSMSSSGTVLCNICQSGYYLVNNTCTNKCLPNCGICQNSTVCQYCDYNYGTDWNNPVRCSYCGFGALFCSFDSATGDIVSPTCLENFINDPNNNSRCIPCQLPCIVCYLTPQNCTLCSQTYFFPVPIPTTSFFQCLFCNISNCIACTSSINCVLCQTGYFLVSSYDNGQQSIFCQQCMDNCQQCNNISSCNLCQAGYYFKSIECIPCPGNNVSFCNLSSPAPSQRIYCMNGYTVQNNPDDPNSLSFCVPCQTPNCRLCQQYQPQNCQWCMNGYYYTQAATCLPCSQNCLNCVNESICVQCSLRFYQYFNQSNNSTYCVPCLPQCETCNNLEGCLTCSQGYFPSPAVITFQSPLYLIQCLPCLIQGCQKCFNSQICFSCGQESGYSEIPTAQGQCIKCPEGCSSCDNQLECESCFDGYLLNDQTKVCLNEQGFPVWAIVGCILLGGFAIFVVVEVGSRMWRRKKEKSLKKMIKQLEMNSSYGIEVQSKSGIN